MKVSTAFVTAALLIGPSAPSFAGNTTAAGSSPSHNSDTDSARNGTPHRGDSTGISTPSDSGSAGTITNGQSAQMPASNSATTQDTDTSADANGKGDSSSNSESRAGSAPAR